jgi:hypothetical protein
MLFKIKSLTVFYQKLSVLAQITLSHKIYAAYLRQLKITSRNTSGQVVPLQSCLLAFAKLQRSKAGRQVYHDRIGELKNENIKVTMQLINK